MSMTLGHIITTALGQNIFAVYCNTVCFDMRLLLEIIAIICESHGAQQHGLLKKHLIRNIRVQYHSTSIITKFLIHLGEYQQDKPVPLDNKNLRLKSSTFYTVAI